MPNSFRSKIFFVGALLNQLGEPARIHDMTTELCKQGIVPSHEVTGVHRANDCAPFFSLLIGQIVRRIWTLYEFGESGTISDAIEGLPRVPI